MFQLIVRRWEGALLLAGYTTFMAAVAMTQS